MDTLTATLAGKKKGGPPAQIEDVFSAYVYTGNGTSQTIHNGINLGDFGVGTSTEFDGVSDYLSRSSDLVGNTDSKTFTFSCWFYYTSTTIQHIYVSSTGLNNQYGLNIQIGSNVFTVLAMNSSFVKILDFTTSISQAEIDTNSWNHVVLSIDLSNTSNRHLVINDNIVTGSWNTYTNDNISHTNTYHSIASADPITSAYKIKGRLSNLFLDYTYRDLSIEANRRLFIDANGGSTSVATQSALSPILYLPMTTDYTVGQNLGTGGDFTANGSPTIVNYGTEFVAGSGDGGMVWIKDRDALEAHQLFDTERGAGYAIASNGTFAQALDLTKLSSFNTDGFSLGTSNVVNTNTNSLSSWTFKKAPRFFDMVKYTGDGVAGRTIAHNLGVAPGMVIIKQTSSAGNGWDVYHRSLGATKMLELNDSVAATTMSDVWNDTEPTSTNITLGTWGGVNANGSEYIAYLFAHDPLGESGDGSDGMIACGSYAGTGASGNFIDLGWEPQYVMIKNTTAAADWAVFDNMRGVVTSGNDSWLSPNTSGTEFEASTIEFNATGFTLNGNYSATNNVNTFIYMAIRRPMKTPTTSSEVFAIDTTSGSPVIDVGFVPDSVLFKQDNAADDHYLCSRLTGEKRLMTPSTAAEATAAMSWDLQESYQQTYYSLINLYYFFKRATGFFDVVCYTGDGVAGRTVNHNLGVAPEMMLVKRRGYTQEWGVYHSSLGSTKHLELNTSAAEITSSNAWNSTTPTDSLFTVGNFNITNNGASGNDYIAYLFATLDGISKVGSYTGNGTSQTIDCGFTTGAKFILIKRTDSTGDWMMWDSVRGIVTGTEGFLELNTTNAEDATQDIVDPDSSGFIVNQEATHNLNVATTGQYIYYAIAN